MPSVTKDRKKYGAPSIYSQKAREERETKDREDTKRFYNDHDPRLRGDNGYRGGRAAPLIEEE